MDPLSISASIAGLLQAGHLLAKGIRALRSVKNAPDDFISLCHEVAMLQTTMKQLQDDMELAAGANGASRPPESLLQSISNALQRIEKTVAELDGLSSRLRRSPASSCSQLGLDAKTSANPAGEENHVRKRDWLREKGAIRKLRQDSQRAREELALCIHSVVSYET
ncbi:hypothetical protein B0T14DRAFT_522684 [Immersiella caudata]|uniref:Fungal N-terminal domain-containing protein n=1 Tax=Immersiella caudata TaxID=314043 RepID=A0AA40BWH6_9PEZI|nr:hypothetical protein B0T14DRAFT_522684 [Immersiella caudata]